jgi:hypothetical protein
MTIPLFGRFRQRDSSPETPGSTSIEVAQRAMADPSVASIEDPRIVGALVHRS